MNIFEKLENVRRLLKESFDLKEAELILMVEKLANRWHYRKKRKGIRLTKEEAKLYEILIRNKYNPSTVYKWFLMYKSPSEVKERLSFGVITIKQAFKEKKDQKYLFNISEKDFLNDVYRAVDTFIVR
jgi:hypothetical protein